MSITKRIDAVTHAPESHRTVAPPAPKSLKIELTAACNLACVFCATPKALREKGHMDFSLYRRIITSAREAGVEELGLFYLGESMLYPKLAEAVEVAKEDVGFPYVFLTTNGVVGSAARFSALFRAGLDSLKFSFNWADGEQMKEVTGINAFERVVKNIQLAREQRDATGSNCGLYASSILYDGEQGERMREAVARIEPFVDEHYWLPLYSQHSLTAEDTKARGYLPIAGNTGRAAAAVPGLPCWAVLTEAHCTWDGKLTACCFSHTEDFTMGDLTQQTFAEAWNSRSFRALRQAHLAGDVRNTPCEACVAYA